MADFVDVVITTNPDQLVDAAIARLAAEFAARGIPGWAANDGDLGIIQLNTIAPMAADTANVAAQVPAAIFRTFGTQLVNVPYNQGAAATASSTWTLTDTVGHTIPAGTYLTITDRGFYVQSDAVVAPGSSTATGVTLVAVEAGTTYNGLSGPVALVDQIDWIPPTGVTVIGETSGGADPETDTAYQTRLAAALALQAPRPITANDFAAFTLAVPSTIVPSGVIVGRATALDGFNPSSNTFTATTSNTSTTLSSVSSFTGVTAGSALAGSGIQSGTTVISVNTGAGTLVMSKPATATATGVSVTATGSYGNARCVTVFVTDAQGAALSSGAMTAIANWLAGYREVNFLVFVQPPSYSTVYVTYQVRPLPGYDPTALVSSVNQSIATYLSPRTWGTPPGPATTSTSSWLNSGQGFNIVRYNKLLGVIENVPGVDYVPPGSTGLAIGLSASPTGTSDLTLPGPAPLPQVNTPTATVIGTTV